MMTTIPSRIRRLWLPLLMLWSSSILWRATPTRGWEWTDWIVGNDYGNDNVVLEEEWSSTAAATTLSLEQVSALRVRDVKRRLARRHGYSADELAAMIFKKELVEALAFEEEKVRLRLQGDLQRLVLQRGVVLAVVVVLISSCWPLIRQAYDVALVNLVVYTDRKKLEARKCWQLKTKWGLLGVALMFIIDLLQAWLTVSILLSWVMAKSKYFFPTPNISIQPAQLMGGPMAQAFGGYGINIGAMLVTWILRFTHGRLEIWTGRAMSAALQAKRAKKASKKKKGNGHDDVVDDENEDDEPTNRATTQQQSRREARRQARQAAAAAAAAPPPDLPRHWMEPNGDNGSHNNHTTAASHSGIPTSREHDQFMQQVMQSTNQEDDGGEEVDSTSGGLDDLD